MSLIPTILYSSVLSFFLTMMMQTITHQSKFERGIASNMELTNTIGLVHLLTGTAEACRRSGLIGVSVAVLPAPVSLNLGGFTLAAGVASPNGTRTIEQLAITSLTPIGSAERPLFLANLTIQTKVQGTAISMRNSSYRFPIQIETDSASRISSCSGLGENTAGGFVPPGAILYFNLSVCPPGWGEVVGARGRYLMGLNPGGTLGGLQGQALTDLEDRPVGEHDHDVYGVRNIVPVGVGTENTLGPSTQPGTISGVVDHTGGARWEGPGGVTLTSPPLGTNAPYIQFLVCEKFRI